MLRETAGEKGLRLGGSLTRGGLYEVVTAAAEWVTERWAATSGECEIERHRAAATEGFRNLSTENQVLRGFSCFFFQGSGRFLENGPTHGALFPMCAGWPFHGPKP